MGERGSICLKPENLCFRFWVKAIEGSKGGGWGSVRGRVWDGDD